MKIKRWYRFGIFLVLFLFSTVILQAECYSIIVGKQASADGAVLLAHNEDDTSPQLVNWYKIPRQQYPAGTKITLFHGDKIDQVPETFEFLWAEMPGMHFSDCYINEWGVSIASNQCLSREKLPAVQTSGIGYMLRRLMAERARTAREAVKIGGKLLEQVGYTSSGRSYVIADPNEGWVLAAVHGKHWVAQRVPDEQVMVIPNYYTIGEVNLADTTHFLGAPDLIDYAIAQGWYDPARDGAFNFRKSYSHPNSLIHTGNVHRKWRGVNLLANQSYSVDEELPFAIYPKHKVTIDDLKLVLRDHYEGTEYDLTAGYQFGSPNLTDASTICANHTQYGFIAHLRSWLPIDIGAVLWLAPRRPDSQAFIPWYLGIEEIPVGYAKGPAETALKNHFQPEETIHEPDPLLAYWSFVELADCVDQDYGRLIPKIRQFWQQFEADLLKMQPGFEKKVRQIYQTNPEDAKNMLTQFTAEAAQRAWDGAKECLNRYGCPRKAE